MRALIALLAVLSTAPASAQDLLTPNDFLDLADGRTLTFVTEPGGFLVGIEQFLTRDQTIWTRADGSCAYGVVTTTPLTVCFAYDDDPGRQHCWYTYSVDGVPHVRATDTGSIQRVDRVGDEPVSCEALPTV